MDIEGFKSWLGFRRYRAFIFALIGVSYILVYFHRNGTAVVAIDMMEDLGAEAFLIGLLASGYFYSYAFMQLPTGILSDSWGVRKTVTVTTFVAGVGSIIFGLAANIEMAIIGRVIVGIGVSTVYVCALKFISQWYRKDEFATMNGVLIGLGGIGLLISTIPLAYLSILFGWRSPFIIFGVVSIAVCFLIWVFVRNRPYELGFDMLHRDHENYSKCSITQSTVQIIKTREFWPASIWLFCSMAIYISLGGLWGGPFLIQVYGLSKMEASTILSMIAAGMIIGSPLLGYLSDKVLKRRKVVLLFASSMLMLQTCLLAMFYDSMPKPGLYAFFFGLGIFAIGVNPVVYATIKDTFHLELAGTCIGLANFFPFIGGAIFQPLMGYVLESGGKVGDSYVASSYQHVIIALAITSIVAFVSTLLISEKSPKR